MQKKQLIKNITILCQWSGRILVFIGFICVSIAIAILQLLATFFYKYKQNWYYKYIRRTKKHAGVICMAIAKLLIPSYAILYGDKIILSHFEKDLNKKEEIEESNRFIFISNHQIYIDWFYIWWIAYLKKIDNGIYIVLKDSLKRIPIIGWGMKTFGFIFLSRSWQEDHLRFNNHFRNLSLSANQSMLLLLYPEGTNISLHTKHQSLAYVKKNDLPILDYVLLPRIKGLYFCLKNLHKTTKYLYDCTIGYEGVTHNTYAQDIYTLKSILFDGQFPKNVHIHLRRFSIDTVPLDNEDQFKNWLYNLWIEKDKLMHQFINHGYFPGDFTLKRKIQLDSILEILSLWDVYIVIFLFIIFIYYFLKIIY